MGVLDLPLATQRLLSTAKSSIHSPRLQVCGEFQSVFAEFKSPPSTDCFRCSPSSDDRISVMHSAFFSGLESLGKYSEKRARVESSVEIVAAATYWDDSWAIIFGQRDSGAQMTALHLLDSSESTGGRKIDL